jgi:hypothetical protein
MPMHHHKYVFVWVWVCVYVSVTSGSGSVCLCVFMLCFDVCIHHPSFPLPPFNSWIPLVNLLSKVTRLAVLSLMVYRF